MKSACLLACLAFIYFGCTSESDQPKLSPDYLQPIFSEIKKIDSSARILKFFPGNEKFERLDKIIKSSFFETGPYDVQGSPIEVIEQAKTSIDDSSTTRYILAGQRIIEKVMRDSAGTVIHRMEYDKDIIDQIIEIRPGKNDTSKIRYRYDKNKKLIRRRTLSSSGIITGRYELTYLSNGNLDYVYTITGSEGNGFEKFEFNNKDKQYIVSGFDKDKFLKWIFYIEYDSSGNVTCQEKYFKEYENPVFRKDRYKYNPDNEVISLETSWPITQRESRYDFLYPQRDSVNNWVEQIIFENDNYFMTTKRMIKYDRKR